MKLIGYPHAGTPPWPPLDESEFEWRPREDCVQEYEDRGFNFTDELVDLYHLAYNLNSKLLDMKIRHLPLEPLKSHTNQLYARIHRGLADLNPAIYEPGDVLAFRMFPTDEPLIVEITGTHFDTVNGRRYLIKVPSRPDTHIPGAGANQLAPVELPNLKSAAAKASQRVDAAHAAFRNLGSWRDQRTAYQRRDWQLAKLNVASAEREAREAALELKKPVRLLLTYTPPPPIVEFIPDPVLMYQTELL